MAILKDLYRRTSSYFKLAGEESEQWDKLVLEDFEACPCEDRTKKYYAYISKDNEGIAVMDLIKNFPDSDLTYGQRL